MIQKWVHQPLLRKELGLLIKSSENETVVQDLQPCNLGFGVTNLLLTYRQSYFYREWKENRKKVLTYPINDG